MDDSRTTNKAGANNVIRPPVVENGTDLRSRVGHTETSPTDKSATVVMMDNEEKQLPAPPSRLSNFRTKCKTTTKPLMLKSHPLPEEASCLQRVKRAFLLPPHGNLAQYMQFWIVVLQIWGVLVALTLSQALPGGNFFSLLALFVGCVIAGYFMSFTKLPPLLGMLIMGVILRNVPGVKVVGENIDVNWSGALRKLALTVILTRAGLGLDLVKLKKLSFAVIRLAFLPCLAEALTVGVVSHYLLNFNWTWSLLLGFILAALSPAVTVPQLVNLQDRKYGVAKGIPTMGLAAGGLDNVLCITGFAVFFGIIFSDGSLAVTIVKGPVGVIVGIAYGFLMGGLLWYLPAKDSSYPVFYRSMMLLGSGMIAIFGSSAVGLSGAGPLGCLTTAAVASYKWRNTRLLGEPDEIANVMGLAWLIVQHFLFGLIGAAVNIGDIQGNTAGLGIATLFIGLFVRSLVSSTVTLGTGFNTKERAFITMTWLSKATVQAAIGGLALNEALLEPVRNEEHVKNATDVLTISVLAIVICAPLGATLMSVLGPKFLAKGDEETDTCHSDSDEKNRDDFLKDTPSVAETIELALPSKVDSFTEVPDVIVPQSNTEVKSAPPRMEPEIEVVKDEVVQMDEPEADVTALTANQVHGDVGELTKVEDVKLEEVEDDKVDMRQMEKEAEQEAEKGLDDADDDLDNKRYSSEVKVTLKIDECNKVRVDSVVDTTDKTDTTTAHSTDSKPFITEIAVTTE